MTRPEMTALIAQRCGVTLETAAGARATLFAAIAADLVAHGEIRLPELGTLTLKPTKARPGRNPRTGAEIMLAAGYRTAFKSNRALHQRYADHQPAAREAAE